MIRIASVIVLLFLLNGCAHMDRQDILAARTLVVVKCPVLKNYNRADQVKAAQELKELGVDSEVANMLVDYSKMRDACRAIVRKLK